MESVNKLREACKEDSHVDCTLVPHAICNAFGLLHRPYGWESVLLPVCDAIEAEVAERYKRAKLFRGEADTLLRKRA